MAALTPVRRMLRALWLLLAAVDACLLVYLAVSFRWLAHEVPSASTPAAIVVYAIVYGGLALVTAFEVGLVVAIAAGIARQFRGGPGSSRRRPLVAAIPALALLIAIAAWALQVLPLASIRQAARVDRIEVFNQLAEPAGNMWRPLGLVVGDDLSLGLYLGIIAVIAYLSEKYFMAWLRVPWPMPLAPIAMVASLVWVIITGEQVQREFVASREWRPVAEAQTYPEALGACSTLGSGWTLPRPSELQLYLSTLPEPVRTLKGVAWTNTAAENGHTRGVVVELTPRKSGVWHRPATGVWQRQEEVNRSVSGCEIDTRERNPNDVFTQLKAPLCQSTPDSPRMHTTTLSIVVLRQGLAAEFGRAATVCVKRGSQQGDPGLGGRTYRDEQEFSSAEEYLAAVRTYCAARSWPQEISCFTLAGEQPAFEENLTERMYRMACDHEGRVDGCTGYAALMERRGAADRASQYRQKADLLSTRASGQAGSTPR